MTNKERLLRSMSDMSYDILAQYLEGSIGEDISLAICHDCQKANGGKCLKESRRLERCPKTVADWLREEAC